MNSSRWQRVGAKMIIIIYSIIPSTILPFLNSYGGNQAAAYGAVLSAGQSYVTVARISGVINAYNQITVSVNGFNITIRGNVINGCLHIGTFYQMRRIVCCLNNLNMTLS